MGLNLICLICLTFNQKLFSSGWMSGSCFLIKVDHRFRQHEKNINIPRASSYEPGNRAGRDEFCGVFIWKISARSTRMNSRNTAKMVEHKLILFATVRTLWTLVTLLIKLFRILLKWKYIQDQNYTILAAIWWKRSYFVENVSSRSPSWSGKIFIPVLISRSRSQKPRSR